MALLILSIPLLILGFTMAIAPLVIAARHDLERSRAPIVVAPPIPAEERAAA